LNNGVWMTTSLRAIIVKFMAVLYEVMRFNTSYNKLRVAYNNAFRLLVREPRWCRASELFIGLFRNATSSDAGTRSLIFVA